MPQLEFSYPAWYLFLCLLAGSGLAFWLYYKDQTFAQLKHGKVLIYTLLGLRALLMSVLFVLLLSPLLKFIHTETEKPVIVILKDGSRSLPMALKEEAIRQYHTALDNLKDKLSDKFDVKFLKFGSEVSNNDIDSLNETATDIAAALKSVYENYNNKNLGAIILASDGIYNKGSNPVYLPEIASVPIFTIPVGDTTVRRDVAISKVNANNIVYLGNSFTMQIFGKALSCAASSTTLTVSLVQEDQEKKLFEKNIVISNNAFSFSQEVLLNADRSGVNHYRVRLSPVDNEVTLLNNVKDVYVDIRESKDKILIMADAPHPDIAAINMALQETKNYAVEVRYQPEYPTSVQDYKLIIFHQLPTGDALFNTFIPKVKERKLPVLYILGSETAAGALNNMQSAVKLTGVNGSINNAQAVFNPDFALFTLSENTKNRLSNFPPLQTVFADYKTAPNTITMLKQKVGNVVTNYPLIAFEQGLQSNTGIIAGEGLWRWRLYDYQKNKNQDAFNEIIRRCVQYLVNKADNKPFRVYVQNESGGDNVRVFGENEPVIFSAELYNDAGELVNIPDVKLVITSKEGKEFPFQFNKTYNAYSLNAGSYTAGNYTWKATTTFNNRNLVESGSFKISPIQLESLNLTADYALLNQLAANSGGKMITPSDAEEIFRLIEANENIRPVLYTINKTESVINLKVLFAILLLLLSLEWFLRKYNGSY